MSARAVTSSFGDIILARSVGVILKGKLPRLRARTAPFHAVLPAWRRLKRQRFAEPPRHRRWFHGAGDGDGGGWGDASISAGQNLRRTISDGAHAASHATLRESCDTRR
ncbi:unnamed protein product [Lampetra planeri]